MAHLGEQAITGDRQHDCAERLDDGAEPALLADHELADALNGLVDRILVERHWNARLIREAARRIGR